MTYTKRRIRSQLLTTLVYFAGSGMYAFLFILNLNVLWLIVTVMWLGLSLWNYHTYLTMKKNPRKEETNDDLQARGMG